MGKNKKGAAQANSLRLVPDDWKELGRRLESIEESVKAARKKWWEIWLFPIVAWISAIIAALISARYTAELKVSDAEATKRGELRASKVYGDSFDLYAKIRDSRVKIFDSLVKYLAAKGTYIGIGEDEDAAEEIFRILDARGSDIPRETAEAMRNLVQHVAETKLRLSKLPGANWTGLEGIYSKARELNTAAEAAIGNWRHNIYSQKPQDQR